MKLYQFPPRRRPASIIEGLFWLKSPAQQQRRIKELARSLSLQTIATITRLSLSVVTAMAEGAPL